MTTELTTSSTGSGSAHCAIRSLTENPNNSHVHEERKLCYNARDVSSGVHVSAAGKYQCFNAAKSGLQTSLLYSITEQLHSSSAGEFGLEISLIVCYIMQSLLTYNIIITLKLQPKHSKTQSYGLLEFQISLMEMP